MEIKYPDAKHMDSFERGLQFQDFVCVQLAKHGLILQNFCSRKYQYEVGESLQGFEIKLDERCTDSKRLSIEIGEKTRAANSNFAPSGIYRNDNTWLYIQGNKQILFIFAKQHLVSLHRSGRYTVVTPRPTIQTFFMPFTDAERYCVKFFRFDIPDERKNQGAA